MTLSCTKDAFSIPFPDSFSEIGMEVENSTEAKKQKDESLFFFKLTFYLEFPIQYINEDFLKRCTKTNDLSTVHHLCLTSSVIQPYRIKVCSSFIDFLMLY